MLASIVKCGEARSQRGRVPVGMAALLVRQTACLGRINTGLGTNPSLQTLFLSVRNPEVLKVFRHEALWFHNLLPLACQTRTSCFYPSHFQAERRRLSLVFECQHFLEDALVLDVCAASADPAAAVVQVCPCREWKNKTGGPEESWPALLIWHHSKRGWLCRLQWL